MDQHARICTRCHGTGLTSAGNGCPLCLSDGLLLRCCGEPPCACECRRSGEDDVRHYEQAHRVSL